MDLFGFQQHDDRHDQLERQMRRLVEQVAQLTIDLAVTRTELRSLELQVSGKADDAHVDPVLIAINNGLGRARASLAAATGSAEAGWNEVSSDLSESLAELRSSLEDGQAVTQ